VADDLMLVDVPEGELDGIRVERFEVTANAIENWRLARDGRSCRPGTYTRLLRDGALWMSDTTAEQRDHMPAYRQMRIQVAKRVVINGLGLGMIVRAALSLEHVEHVDIVELDPRVVALVGPHYTRDPRVTIHTADAYAQAKAWAPGTSWDVGWSDIWGDVSTDTLVSMTKLRRSYGRRCIWHDCWGRAELIAIREREERQSVRWRW
jgi:hypothetical protein